MRHKIIASLFFILLFNCAGSENANSNSEDTLKKLSLEKFGSSFQIVANSDRSYFLVVGKEKQSPYNPNPVLRFFVFEMKTCKITFEESLHSGKVKWRNNDQLEVSFNPEVVTTEENNKLYGYIYNVRLGTKTDLGSESIKPN